MGCSFFKYLVIYSLRRRLLEKTAICSSRRMAIDTWYQQSRDERGQKAAFGLFSRGIFLRMTMLFGLSCAVIGLGMRHSLGKNSSAKSQLHHS